MSMTLPAFLLARYEQDELFWQTVGEMKQAHPERVSRYLADLAAKRRIIEQWAYHDDFEDRYDDNQAGWAAQGLYEAMTYLAVVYADHPDYDQDWKP